MERIDPRYAELRRALTDAMQISVDLEDTRVPLQAALSAHIANALNIGEILVGLETEEQPLLFTGSDHMMEVKR